MKKPKGKRKFKEMIIGKFVITHDTKGYTVYRKRKSKENDKTTREVAGHYGTMKETLKALPEKALLFSNYETLQEVIAIIKKYHKLIEESISDPDMKNLPEPVEKKSILTASVKRRRVLKV